MLRLCSRCLYGLCADGDAQVPRLPRHNVYYLQLRLQQPKAFEEEEAETSRLGGGGREKKGIKAKCSYVCLVSSPFESLMGWGGKSKTIGFLTPFIKRLQAHIPNPPIHEDEPKWFCIGTILFDCDLEVTFPRWINQLGVIHREF